MESCFPDPVQRPSLDAAIAFYQRLDRAIWTICAACGQAAVLRREEPSRQCPSQVKTGNAHRDREHIESGFTPTLDISRRRSVSPLRARSDSCDGRDIEANRLLMFCIMSACADM